MFIDEEDKYLRREVTDKLEEFVEKHKLSKELKNQCSQERIYGDNGVAVRN